MNIPLNLFKHVQLVNMVLFGTIGAQMLLVPVLYGMLALDYFPLGGICFAIVVASWLGYHYHFNPVARSILLALDFLCIGLCFLWLVEFSGPYDRLLQSVLLVFIGVNITGIVLNIVSGVHAHKEKDVAPAARTGEVGNGRLELSSRGYWSLLRRSPRWRRSTSFVLTRFKRQLARRRGRRSGGHLIITR